jgi:hypothetical protein
MAFIAGNDSELPEKVKIIRSVVVGIDRYFGTKCTKIRKPNCLLLVICGTKLINVDNLN